MWPFPKRLIEWKEPEEFLRIKDVQELSKVSPLLRPMLMALVLLFAMANWRCAHYNPANEPVSYYAAVILALFLSLFLVNVVPAMNRACSSEVRIFSNCILRLRGNRYVRLTLPEIASFCWSRCGEFSVLTLTTKKGRTEFIGVPSGERQRIDAVLSDLGLHRSEESAFSGSASSG